MNDQPVKFQYLEPLEFTPETLNFLGDALVAGRYFCPAVKMTRAELEAAYPGVKVPT